MLQPGRCYKILSLMIDLCACAAHPADERMGDSQHQTEGEATLGEGGGRGHGDRERAGQSSLKP